MKVLLDTHILIWASTGQLSESRTALMQSPGMRLFVSSISLWEVTKLVEYKRIEIDEGLDHFLGRVHGNSNFTVVDLLPGILTLVPSVATKVGKDPADQIIVATAMHIGAKLMSDDRRIADSKLVGML